MTMRNTALGKARADSPAWKTGSAPKDMIGHEPDRESARYGELMSLFREHSFQQHFQPNSTVALHGEPADAIYLVVSGTVRCSTVDPDGCRQIFCFAKKGGFIGLSDIDAWHFTAEAVDHVIVNAVPRAVMERHLKENPLLRQEVRTYICKLVEQRERQLLSLVNKRAPERLHHFLNEFASSRPGAGRGPVALPMCRRDIADHLGMSMETVSRAFTELKQKRQIELSTPEKYRMLPRIAASHACL